MKTFCIGAAAGFALVIMSGTIVHAQQQQYCIRDAAQSDSYISWDGIKNYFSSLSPQSGRSLRMSRLSELRVHILRVLSTKALFVEVVERDLGRPVPRWSEETLQRIPATIKDIGAATGALKKFSATNDEFRTENAFVELQHHLESRKSITFCLISNAAAHQQFTDMRRYVNRLKEEMTKIIEADRALAAYIDKVRGGQ